MVNKDPIAICEVVGIGGEFNVYLAEKKERVVVLPECLRIEYWVLDGKHASGEGVPASIVELSELGARIRLGRDVEALTNLKFHLFDESGTALPGDLYGKVMEPGAETSYVRFTSVPADLTKHLALVLSAASVSDSALSAAQADA